MRVKRFKNNQINKSVHKQTCQILMCVQCAPKKKATNFDVTVIAVAGAIISGKKTQQKTVLFNTRNAVIAQMYSSSISVCTCLTTMKLGIRLMLDLHVTDKCLFNARNFISFQAHAIHQRHDIQNNFDAARCVRAGGRTLTAFFVVIVVVIVV